MREGLVSSELTSSSHVTSANGSARYVAPQDRDGPVTATLPFDQWWNDKVLDTGTTAVFSRWDLIETMAHKDGGAHVDPSGVTEEYEQFKLKGAGSFTVRFMKDAPGIPDWSTMEHPGDAASPTVLQIAWELVETLKRAGLPDGPAPA
jgi:hypothetical protein